MERDVDMNVERRGETRSGRDELLRSPLYALLRASARAPEGARGCRPSCGASSTAPTTSTAIDTRLPNPIPRNAVSRLLPSSDLLQRSSTAPEE